MLTRAPEQLLETEGYAGLAWSDPHARIPLLRAAYALMPTSQKDGRQCTDGATGDDIGSPMLVPVQSSQSRPEWEQQEGSRQRCSIVNGPGDYDGKGRSGVARGER